MCVPVFIAVKCVESAAAGGDLCLQPSGADDSHELQTDGSTHSA